MPEIKLLPITLVEEAEKSGDYQIKSKMNEIIVNLNELNDIIKYLEENKRS